MMQTGLEGNKSFENYLRSLSAEQLQVELEKHRPRSAEAETIRRFIAYGTTDEK